MSFVWKIHERIEIIFLDGYHSIKRIMPSTTIPDTGVHPQANGGLGNEKYTIVGDDKRGKI